MRCLTIADAMGWTLTCASYCIPTYRHCCSWNLMHYSCVSTRAVSLCVRRPALNAYMRPYCRRIRLETLCIMYKRLVSVAVVLIARWVRPTQSRNEGTPADIDAIDVNCRRPAIRMTHCCTLFTKCRVCHRRKLKNETTMTSTEDWGIGVY